MTFVPIYLWGKLAFRCDSMAMRDVSDEYSCFPGEYYCYRKEETVVLLKITEVVGSTILCQYISLFRGICIIRDRMKIPVRDLPLLCSITEEVYEHAYSMVAELYGRLRNHCKNIRFLKKVRKVEIGDCFLGNTDMCWNIVQVSKKMDDLSNRATCYHVSGVLDKIEIATYSYILDNRIACQMRRIDPAIIDKLLNLSFPVFNEIEDIVDDRLSLCKKYS